MSAKEMFENLFFEQIHRGTLESKPYIVYRKKYKKRVYEIVVFSYGAVTVCTNNGIACAMTGELIRAIDQQFKEFGWIE